MRFQFGSLVLRIRYGCEKPLWTVNKRDNLLLIYMERASQRHTRARWSIDLRRKQEFWNRYRSVIHGKGSQPVLNRSLRFRYTIAWTILIGLGVVAGVSNNRGFARVFQQSGAPPAAAELRPHARQVSDRKSVV